MKTKSVAVGEIIQVPNTLRRSFCRSALVYWAVIVRHEGDLRVLLLTKHGLGVALNRAGRNPEDWPKNARLWFQKIINYQRGMIL